MRELWLHQKYALEKYKDSCSFGLLFQCGLGKTRAAAAIAEAKDKPVLIIAPSALCQQWADELTNKDEDTRITEKDWSVAVCTSRTKGTKAFRKALDAIKG